MKQPADTLSALPEKGNSSGLILVVDDDGALSEMLQIVLHKEGYKTACCATGSSAVDAFRKYHPDLVLLDVMLPGRNGIEVCRDIRKESGVPIVMLTALSDTLDVVAGLEAGADDYIAKPFKAKELLARIKARLRKPKIESEEQPKKVYLADLVIDVPAHEVRRDGQLLKLTPLEFDLLLALAAKSNQVYSREQLLEDVWGYRHASDTRLVNVHVQRLRSKIEIDPEQPEIIMTVRGVGYKACETASDQPAQ